MEKFERVRKQRVYDIFKEKCDSMINGKFLLASTTISKVLQCITGAPELGDFIADILKNIDCEREVIRATEQDTKSRFVLPKSNRITVAVVTFLLKEFDMQERNLSEFITIYYDKDVTLGFKMMCENIIVPYRDAVGKLFLGGIEEDYVDEVEPLEVKAELHDQARIIINDIMNCIQADNKITESIRSDLVSLVEGMVVALSLHDSALIHSIWIGMEYSLIRYKRIHKSIQPLGVLLQRFGMI